jgi:hypothetical protein
MTGWISITGDEQNGESMGIERTGLEQLESAGRDFPIDNKTIVLFSLEVMLYY